MRELPYGWDILVENVMDPAHVDFAHHGVPGQDNRYNTEIWRMDLAESAEPNSGCVVHVSASKSGPVSADSPTIMQAAFSPPTLVK